MGYDPSAQKMVPVQEFEPRFVRKEHLAELSNLWHLSRTACAGKSNQRYERLLWTSRQFAVQFNYVSSTGAYKDLDAMLEFGGRA